MKKIFLFILLAASGQLFGQGLYWSFPQTVSTSSETGNVRPRIVLNRAGNPVISWSNKSTGKIYARVLSDPSLPLGPVQVTPGTAKAYIADWTSHEMAAFGDTIYIVFKLNPIETGGSYIVRSTDGGLTFSDTVRIDPPSTKISWIPSVTTDNTGNPVVAYMESDSGEVNPRYVLTSSSDGGLIFSTPVNATGGNAPGEVCDCCPSTVIASGAERYIVFRNNQSNIRTIWATKSTDNGATFTQAAETDFTNSYSNTCQATGPASIIQNDSLVTVWKSTVSGVTRVFVSSSSVSTLQTGTHDTLSKNIPTGVIQNYPRTSGNDTIMGVTWQEYLSGNIDILFSWSANGPLGLISRDTVNDYKTGTQMNPDVKFSNGKFHFVWQDNAQGAVIYRAAGFAPFTGIKESNMSLDIKVFPNPAAGMASVAAPFDGGDYLLLDIYGREVSSGKFKGNVFSISAGRGTYFLKVTNGKESGVTKVTFAD